MKQVRDVILLKLIGDRIKQLRIEKGITQEAFLLDTGIKISRIENGSTNLSVSTLNLICKHLNISMSDFFISLKLENRPI